MLSRPPAAILALAAVAGCGSENDVIFMIAGEAPGAVVLFVRVVDDRGLRDKVHSVGDASKPVKLPASVHMRVSNTARVGAVVWLADAAGTIVAQGRTEKCPEMAAGRYELVLQPAPDGWSPSTADRCRCNPADPLGPMCPAPAGADGGITAADGLTVLQPEAGADGAPDATSSLPDDAGTADAAPDAPADAGADARDASPDRASDVRLAADMSSAAVPGGLFGFEDPGSDWTSTDTMLMRDTTRTEGAASLAFTVGPSGVATIRSRSFDTSTLSASGTRLSVDVFVNEAQMGDANTEMWVDCQSASVFGVYMGYKALTGLKAPGWTQLNFNIPAQVMSAFKGKFTDCQVWFELEGKGLFRYDRMGFAP